MEMVAPVPEFHFHTAMNTPYISAPSSPPNNFSDSSSFFEFNHHHHHNNSAPNSPTSAAAIYAALRKNSAATRGSRHSSVPFDWEEMPGRPKSSTFDEKDEFDFDFDFSLGFREKIAQPSPGKVDAFVAADQLFELGKIRPLKPPPRLYSPVMGEQIPKSPRSGGFLSPLRRGRNQRGKELDPFVLAMMEATKSRRESSSISPFGGGEKGGSFMIPASSPPPDPSAMAGQGGRGWKYRIKEFLLFRSSSEGRVGGERKNNDFCEHGSSSSSSSSASSNSSVGSEKGKTRFGVAAAGGGGGGCGELSCSSFGTEEKGSEGPGGEIECKERRTAVVKKTVGPYKQNTFIVRGFAGGKFIASFIRRRS